MNNSLQLIEEGKGDPLVLLHGFMCNKEIFYSQIKFFSKYFKVIAYDLYGFGSNKPATSAYTLNDYINEFCSVVHRYGTKVNVIAHSFGCRIALKSSAINDNVNKLVLCGAAGLKPHFSLRKFLKRKVYKIAKPFFPKEYLERHFFSSDYNMLDDIMKKSFKLVTNEYLDDILPYVKARSFAIFGAKDDQTPLYIADRLVKNIPSCSKYIMRECGHFCFTERPMEFNNVVREFLV